MNGKTWTRKLAGAAVLALFGLAGAALAAGGSVVEGASKDAYGGRLVTWATLDADGNVVEAGVTVPLATIEGAPTDAAAGHEEATAVLDFPGVVQRTTFLNNAGIFWNPHGHEPPERYGAPHWDFHFYAPSAAEIAAIDCSDATQPDPQAMPKGWLPPVPPGTPPQAMCVPMMGYHALPATEFKAPGQLQDGLFDKVMIAGYYGGRTIFLEPMVTKAVLMTRQSFDLPVPQPSALGTPTLYPATFQARYDDASRAYHLVFSDFRTVR